MMSFTPVKTKPVPSTANYVPSILTDEVLSKLRAKEQNKNHNSTDHSLKILNALMYIGEGMKMHLPVVGELFSTSIKNTALTITNDISNQITNLQYLTGQGPVGSYLADQIDTYNLFNTPINGKYKTVSPIEEEYKQLFDYKPIVIQQNNRPKEVDELKLLFDNIQSFCLKSQFQLNETMSKFIIDHNQHDYTVDFKLDLFKTGLYREKDHFGNRYKIVINAPIRDSWVSVVFDFTYDSFYFSNLYYFHRAENAWVKSQYAHFVYLEGTYEVMKQELECFFTEIGIELKSSLNPYLSNCINELTNLYTEFQNNPESKVIEKLISEYKFEFQEKQIAFDVERLKAILTHSDTGYWLSIHYKDNFGKYINHSFLNLNSNSELDIVLSEHMLNAYFLKLINESILAVRIKTLTEIDTE